MTCECEYGKCTEGNGCPVRSTQVQQPDSEESWPILKEMLTDGAYYLGLWTLVFALLSCIAMVVSVAYWGKPLWHWFF